MEFVILYLMYFFGIRLAIWLAGATLISLQWSLEMFSEALCQFFNWSARAIHKHNEKIEAAREHTKRTAWVRDHFGEEEASRYDADPQAWVNEQIRKEKERKEQERQKAEQEKQRQEREQQNRKKQEKAWSPDPYLESLRLLGLPQAFTEKEFRLAYRRAMQAAHPGKGGSHLKAQAINKAREFIKTRQGW